MQPTLEERMQKYFDGKFEALAKDVDESHLKPMKKDFDEKFELFKKELKTEREFNTLAGAGTDKYVNVRDFANLIKQDVVPETYGKSYLANMSPVALKALAGYAKSVYMREHSMGMSEAVTKALGETSGSTGGFFVPIEFKPELLKLVIENQVVRPRATVFPMATDTMWIPRIVDTTHLSTIHGGVTGAWTAEAATIGQGDPAAGQVQLIAKKFADYVLVSNELVMDSAIAIPALLGVLLREGLGFFEDASAIHGNGGGEMLGFMNAAALISTTRTTTGHIKYDDIVNIYSRMLPSSLNNAVWVASPSAFPDIAKMSLAVGTGGSAVWITNYTTAAGAPPATIFGRPLIISEKMAALSYKGDIAFCDFSYYVMGDRMQMALTTSEHVAFAADQTAFRIIERLDGQPWIASALTPHNLGSSTGAVTLSPFVTLAA
jgi:HK97 family phage major capsid protein